MLRNLFKHSLTLAVILALAAGFAWDVRPAAAASASISCSGNNAVVTFSGFSSAQILGSGPGLPTGWLSDGSHTLSGPGAWSNVQVSGFDHDSNPVNISLGSITCPTGGSGGSNGSTGSAPPAPDSDGDGLDDNNDPCPHDPDPNAVPDKDGYCPKDERAGRNGSQDSVVTYNTHGTNTQSIWVQGADGRYYKAAEWAPELLQYARLLPPGASWEWSGLDGRMFQITHQGNGRFEGVTPDGQKFWFQRSDFYDSSGVFRFGFGRFLRYNFIPGIWENASQAQRQRLYALYDAEDRMSVLANNEEQIDEELQGLREKRKEVLRDLDEVLPSLHKDALNSAFRILQKMIEEREAQLNNIRNQWKATRAIRDALLKWKP